MKFPARWHTWAAAYLVLQSLLVTAWWVLLAVSPSARDYFKPATAPDAMLFAFALPDAIFFIIAAWWSAWRLIREPHRAMLPLALHVGGAIYAWLYCLLLWMLSGAGLAGAVCMLFCAILPSLFLWKLCQADGIEP